MKVTCPSCGRSGRVPDEAVGKTVRCPACAHRYALSPDVASASREAPAAQAQAQAQAPAPPRPEPETYAVRMPPPPAPGPARAVSRPSPAPGRVEAPTEKAGASVSSAPSSQRKRVLLVAGAGAAAAGLMLVVIAVIGVAMFNSGPGQAEGGGSDEALAGLRQLVGTSTLADDSRSEPAGAAPVASAAARASSPGRPMSTAEIAAESEPSIALIKGKASSGTGFLVAPNLLVTNAHVVDEEFIQDLEVRFPSAPAADQGPIGAELLYEDPKRDLAFLSVSSPLPALRVARSFQYRKGEDVTVIGNPGIGNGGGVLENAINRGVLSSKTTMEGQAFYQMGIAVNPGNSGGPVFDSTGQVIGVVTLRIPDKQELAFCIPVEELCAAQAKVAGQSEASAAGVRSRHRMIVAYKDLTSAGAIYGLTLELRAALKAGARSTDLTQATANLDKAVDELEAGPFANLEREMAAMQDDEQIEEQTRSKLGDLSNSYEKLKAAYARNAGSVPLMQVQSMKRAHRRLVDMLRSDIKVELPPQLLALYDDHVTLVAGQPNLGVNPALAGPGSPLRSRIWEKRGLTPPGGRTIGPPSRITRPGGRPLPPRPGR